MWSQLFLWSSVGLWAQFQVRNFIAFLFFSFLGLLEFFLLFTPLYSRRSKTKFIHVSLGFILLSLTSFFIEFSFIIRTLFIFSFLGLGFFLLINRIVVDWKIYIKIFFGIEIHWWRFLVEGRLNGRHYLLFFWTLQNSWSI